MVEFFSPTWDDIEEQIFRIARKMATESFYPDVIVAILTGGVIPAKLFADILNMKNIKYIDIKFYRDVNQTDSKPVIRAVYVNDLENKKVLVVDDVSDTGETLEAVTNVISMFSPRLIRTATLYVKPWSRKIPDYFGEQVGKWIIFPWDKWDVVRSNPEAPVAKKEKYFELHEIFSKMKG
ncbi:MULTISPECIES: phosphoribosyltransferase [Metallosphaera]|uniref:Phosphoribosyltransferase n=3 Tax=Metallosphaera TaxID=41980 RepID=A4YEG0_METS5|nr:MULTISPECIES: phosphoribosyltransferase [Metallosphaera]ABP94812.1 phosphoribosyltransferase [Metallosphaera sedula DSM 5348]AIM26799.1 phosphoribosyltransferase [Metallosphaera sedula]AKV73751.1 phosphoribosyltransferase [Metallosphaera sedula]AKV75991.1 phosphoribosyltransferase [Metallosphaera sedula]AKV78242.1 phosphoribosyltransferase [Metallosphaera sedula]